MEGARNQADGAEVLTIAEMREADRRTIAAGVSGYALMRRAGAAVAEAVLGRAGKGARVLVACGPGNNGGDGFVAAADLRREGIPVTLALLGPGAALTGDAALAARDWPGPVLDAETVDIAAYDVIVDALFGAGLSRPLEGAARALVERIGEARRPVVAVDVPSGIDGDTGEVRGAAVRADETVTFARLKPGHLLMPGRAHCGRVTVADIGIADGTVAAIGPRLRVNEPRGWLAAFPRPSDESHKYARGHCLALSGPATRTGAARLAARAALRAGAGLVTLASPSDALGVNAGHLTAVMLSACDDAFDLAAILDDPRFNALVLGPGLGVGERTRAFTAAALEARRAVVLDADALTSHEGRTRELSALIAAAAPRPVVLTPHGGEMARLFRDRPDVLDTPSKLERTRRAAAALGAVVVLKGADTVVAAPDGRATINRHATPYLATAGSGDVLAGLVAGLLAQGMPGFEAAGAGVWLHGAAGLAAGPGLIAEDLPERLPEVLRDLSA